MATKQSKSKSKSKRLRARRRKERMRRLMIQAGVLLGCCAAAVVLLVVLTHNRSGSDDLQSTMERAVSAGNQGAQGAEVALDASLSEDGSSPLTTPQATYTPTPSPVPTFTPTPSPEPTPIPTPTPEPTPVTVTLTCTGDITLSTYRTRFGTTSSFASFVEKYGYDYFLENFRDYFSQDDLTLVNLEGPLTTADTKRPGQIFNFKGKPEYVNILTGSSVEVANLGNNHAMDYKKAGFEETVETLRAAGIGPSGYGVEYYTDVKGVTVGFIGFTEWHFEKKQILKAVAAAKNKCDLLIVSMHWGVEGYETFTSYSRSMGKQIIDAGADLVVGNHPHVPGAIMKYNGKYIIHTLGNFCFGGNDQPGRHVRRCAVFRQKFIVNPDGSVEDGGIDIVPGWISGTIKYNDFHPLIANEEDGKGILSDMVKATKTNFDWSEIKWLDDSYVYQHGILEKPTTQAG